jgi:hypothetical protein
MGRYSQLLTSLIKWLLTTDPQQRPDAQQVKNWLAQYDEQITNMETFWLPGIQHG